MSPARALCKLAALLLRYPDGAWRADLEGIGKALTELPQSWAAEALSAFASQHGAQAPEALQAEYVSTFDFGEDTSLHLTAHVFGPERERAITPQRGHALAQLGAAYAAHGLELLDGELPDFLPVLLEFAAEAGCPPELTCYMPVLLQSAGRLHARLQTRGSPYAPVVAAAHCALAEVFHERGNGG